jgi:hypothetical protein
MSPLWPLAHIYVRLRRIALRCNLHRAFGPATGDASSGCALVSNRLRIARIEQDSRMKADGYAEALDRMEICVSSRCVCRMFEAAAYVHAH